MKLIDILSHVRFGTPVSIYDEAEDDALVWHGKVSMQDFKSEGEKGTNTFEPFPADREVADISSVDIRGPAVQNGTQIIIRIY